MANPADRGRRSRIRLNTFFRYPSFWWYFETDPVRQSEFLLRTIPAGINYYNPDLVDPVARLAFEPMKRDTDGVSLFRLDFVSARDLAGRSTNKKGVFVAKLRTKDILQEGFTVEPKIDPDVPGHVIIPELTYSNYKLKKAELVGPVLILAKLAGQQVMYSPKQTSS